MEKLEITIQDDYREGVLEVIRHIRPEWKSDDVVIETIDGGNMNLMYKCELPEDRSQDDVIIIRVYGLGTEMTVNRERELLVMRLVHSIGLGAPVYCRFVNGIALKFQPGENVRKLIADEEIARLIALKLASLHQVEFTEAMNQMGETDSVEKISHQSHYVDHLKAIFPYISDSCEDAAKNKVRTEEFPSKEKVLTVVETLENKLMDMTFPDTLCHGDFHPSNIIYDSKTGNVHLIDWELSGVTHPFLDVAVYFAGFSFEPELKTDEDDLLKLYPSKEYQLKWIRWYLEHRAELSGENPECVTEDEVNRWYKASIISAMLWTQAGSFFFLLQEVMLPFVPHNFRKARLMQRIFNKIKNEHYWEDL